MRPWEKKAFEENLSFGFFGSIYLVLKKLSLNFLPNAVLRSYDNYVGRITATPVLG